MSPIERTVIKSPPEVWELVDDEDRARGWLNGLAGVESEIEAVERRDGELIIWRNHEDTIELEFELSEKGWGTSVSVRARPDGHEKDLEQVLDELSEPEVQPFSREG
jgi:hypothetical protein